MIEGYAADWTTDQIRNAAQKVADRIDDAKKPLKAKTSFTLTLSLSETFYSHTVIQITLIRSVILSP